MIRGYLCVALAGAVVLPAPDDSLQKFEEKMKKKWDSILDKHPIADAASPAVLDALPTDVAPTTSEQPEHADFAAELARLKALPAELKQRLHEDVAKAAPEPGVPDLLANLHQHIHDVHSSVHDVLDDTLNHPGIQPAVQSLELGSHTHDDADDGMALAGDFKPANSDDERGAEDSVPDESKVDSEDVAGAPEASKLSSERDEAMHGMKKLMGAVKMIVMLQPMLEPMKQKLTSALEHMAPADQKKANGILKHINALDVYSKVTAGLMAGVIAAKDGPEEQKEKAMATLIVGVKQIQEKVAKELIMMKEDTQALPAEGVPAEESAAAAGHAAMPMEKMTGLLVKLGKKIAEEIKDPANRHNPKVLLDIKLFMAVKDSVEKTQALMMAGSIALKKAKTSEEKAAVKAAVKKGMGKVVTALKSQMSTLKKDALLLAAAAREGKQHEDESSGSQGADGAGETHSEKKNRDSELGEDDAPKSGASAAEPQDSDEAGEGENEGAETTGEEDSDKSSEEAETDEKGDDEGDEAPAPEKAQKKSAAAKPTHSAAGAGSRANAAEEDEAKRNHPEISASDIDAIFGEAADEATRGQRSETDRAPLSDGDAFHLRTH